MDDTAHNNQPADNVAQTQSLTPPVQHVMQPAAPAGVANKENAPGMSHVSEHIHPAPHEAAPVITKEVSPHMELSANPEQPQLTEEHRKLGLREAADSMSAPTTLSDDSSFPLTTQQVTQSQSKEYSVWDSFKWYGKTVGRQMLRSLFLRKDK